MWTVEKVCSNEIWDVYVASCVENGGIYHYKLRNGKLHFADFTPVDRPMYITVQDRMLYTVLRAPFACSTDSGVKAYRLDDTGKPTEPSPILSTKGAVGCHILADGEDIYCANYISGSVIKLPDRQVVHQGHGVHPVRQEGPHAHFVGLTPDRKYICVADLGLDTVFFYDRELNLHTQIKVPEGHGVRHLVFSEDGRFLFAANELYSTVSAFVYNDGAPVLLDTCRTVPADFADETAVAAIRVKDGEIYISNRGHDSIAKIGFSDSKLTLKNTVSCGGKTPRDFCFAGEWLLCANQDSNTVTLHDVNAGFAQAGELPVEMPVCVCVNRGGQVL